MGATVIAAASTDEKLSFAASLGADHIINYTEQELKRAVRELTDGRGVDVVFDPVGGDLSETAFRAIAWNGRYLVIGFAAGDIPAIPLNLPLLKGASIVGVYWGDWLIKEPRQAAEVVAELYDLAATGRVPSAHQRCLRPRGFHRRLRRTHQPHRQGQGGVACE